MRSLRAVFTAMMSLALVFVLTRAGWAQKSMSDSQMVTATATIEAIDATDRLVTLKYEDGIVEEVYAGPEVKRFDELKVGDTVTFRYHESLVLQLHKTEQPLSEPDLKSAVVRGAGPKPSATMSDQVKAVVMVESIDMKIPSITVKTAAGKQVTYRVEDKKNLEGVSAGDRIEITYTQALLISVESPKK